MILLILLISLALRLYGSLWDQGWHLHPDERMLILVADRITFFTNLNPDFFNYGTLPVYLLKGTAQFLTSITDHNFTDYGNILIIGRGMSAVFDTITCFIVYKTARLLYPQKRIAYTASFLYAYTFFAIQNAHFFIVDVYLTTFTAAYVYAFLKFLEARKKRYIIVLGALAGCILATKLTGILFIGISIPVLVYKSIRPLTRKSVAKTVGTLLLFGYFAVMIFYIAMPYAFKLSLPYASSDPWWQIFNPDLIKSLRLQTQMNRNAFIFPYTLQYVGTIPYLYYLKHMAVFGLGPIVFSLMIVGIVATIRTTVHEKRVLSLRVIYLLFAFLYFAVLGRSAVKFMRYMLPIYPILVVTASYGASEIVKNLRLSDRKTIKISVFIAAVAAFWCSLFLRIYMKPHTRIEATSWIYEHLPFDSVIATEHWDDVIPFPIASEYPYTIVTLPMYEPESDRKWSEIDRKLEAADYIVISSNRLYAPLMRLTDCVHLPKERCYDRSAVYYEELFAGKRGYTKIKEFTSYPGLTLGPYSIEFADDWADESFTVYDHPKVMVFEKNLP